MKWRIKHHIIISTDEEKAYPTPFSNKPFNKLGLKEKLSEVDKRYSRKNHSLTSYLNGEVWNLFSKINNKRDICSSLSNQLRKKKQKAFRLEWKN